ncbi:hypothetical protein [Tsukamurella soli]|uniref:hypothetical protein n=1 Tax=Tsukamurella soli TaxID=644556 RepID=UPI0031E64BFF
MSTSKGSSGRRMLTNAAAGGGAAIVSIPVVAPRVENPVVWLGLVAAVVLLGLANTIAARDDRTVWRFLRTQSGNLTSGICVGLIVGAFDRHDHDLLLVEAMAAYCGLIAVTVAFAFVIARRRRGELRP